MSKSKFFTAVITIVISVVILVVIVNIIFSNSKINQGNFRVSDTLLTSTVSLEDKSEDTSKWKFDISQDNKISMLIQSNNASNIKEVYLENFKISSKNDVHIYVEQDKYDVSYKYKDIKNKKVNIYTEETEDGNFLVEFDIRNEDVVSNYSVPEEVKEIRHDGTILTIAKVPASSIKFDVKYNLVIVEDKGQINTCKIELQMPDTKITTEGFSVERLDSSKFNFKVDY